MEKKSDVTATYYSALHYIQVVLKVLTSSLPLTMHQQPCQWWKLATVVTLLVVAKSVLGDPKNNGLGARKTAMETRWAPTIFASTAMPEVLGQVGLNPQCLDIVPPHALNGIRQGLFYPKVRVLWQPAPRSNTIHHFVNVYPLTPGPCACTPVFCRFASCHASWLRQPPKTGSASEKGSLSSFAKVAGLVAAPPARGFNPDWNDANTGMRSVQQWCERQKHPAVSITRHNPIGAWIDSCMEYPLTVTTMRNPVDHRLSYVNYFLHLLKHENTLSSPANTLPDTLRSDPAFQFQPKDVPDLIFNATSFQYQAFNFLATWQFGFYGDIEPLWTVPRWQHWMQSLVLCELTQGQVKDPTVWEAIGMPSIHQFLQTVTFSKTMWEPSLLQLLSNVTAAVHRASLEFSQVPITASTLSNSVAAVFHRLYDVIIVTEKLDEGNIIFRHTVKPLGSNKLFHPCALIPKEINVSSSVPIPAWSIRAVPNDIAFLPVMDW